MTEPQQEPKTLGPFLTNGKDGRDGKDGRGLPGIDGHNGVDGKGLTPEQDAMLKDLPSLVKQLRPFGKPLWVTLLVMFLAACFIGVSVGAAIGFIH